MAPHRRPFAKNEPISAQTYLVKKSPHVIEPSLDTLPAFEIAAVAAATGKDHDHIRAGFECLQQMLGLKLARAGYADSLERADKRQIVPCDELRSACRLSRDALEQDNGVRRRLQIAFHVNSIPSASIKYGPVA